MRRIAFLLMIVLLLVVVGRTRPDRTGAWLSDSETTSANLQAGTWTSPVPIPELISEISALTSCTPDLEGQLGRVVDGQWHIKAYGTGAFRGVRLLTSWQEPLVWEESDPGKVELNLDGTWTMDINLSGPEDGSGEIQVLGADDTWHSFIACSFAGKTALSDT